ncbi:hypothetical protein LCI18_010817 [Fusarium solani-melongenae]|uniref:Uncharacterized protein n=1 Tax=Fusarium solani subsp. cucurbitae TaxID=2747967 RepID=A0ACD3ZFY3_FUSSC|nr:hypothetical protein LCI18_010817 [Fusarium solani-melongenae]
MVLYDFIVKYSTILVCKSSQRAWVAMEPMDPMGLAAVTALGVVAVAQLCSKQMAKGYQFLNDCRFFQPRKGKSASEDRFRLVMEVRMEDANMDIVFIHGLRTSWTIRDQQGHQVNFLRHDLPELCDANIMVYNYDTTLRSSEFLMRRTLFYETKQLLNRLVNQRADDPSNKRPIIFVAHSLGGILLKNALVFSTTSEKENEQDIFKSTTGIVFLGTPHESSPSRLAEAIWEIVQPNLSPEQIHKSTWRHDEFYSRARALAYDTGCFESIIGGLPVRPIYISQSAITDGCDGAVAPLEALRQALGKIRQHLLSSLVRPATPEPKTTQPGSNKELIDFAVGTNLTSMGKSTPSWLSPWRDSDVVSKGQVSSHSGMPPIILNETKPWAVLNNNSEHRGTDHALGFAKGFLAKPSNNPYLSIFFIKATTQASIGVSFLGIYRKILSHYSKTIGLEKASQFLGVEGISETADSEILSNPEMLISTVEAVTNWLGRPQNDRWLLIIDDVPVEEASFIRPMSGMERTRDSILMVLMKRMLLLRYSPGSKCHIIYTTQGGQDDVGTTAVEYKSKRPDSVVPVILVPGELDEVGLRILSLCLVLSDESTQGIWSEVFHHCGDLLAAPSKTAIAKSAIEHALRHLIKKQILEPTPGSRFRYLRVRRAIWTECRLHLQSNPDRRATHDLVTMAWACLERLAITTSKWSDHTEQWDLRTSLVENCSAAVRWCANVEESLWLLDADLSILGELCERHSAWSTAITLYESDYRRQLWLPSQLPITGSSIGVEAAFRLARTYFLSGVIDKAEEKCGEAITLIKKKAYQAPNLIVVDAFRLEAALTAYRGRMATATAKLEDLLGSVGDCDHSDEDGDNGDWEKKCHAAFLSIVRDLSNYLARCGDYGTAASLLRRALLVERRQKLQNQPTILLLLESMAALYRRQGELRQAEHCYSDAQSLTDLWLGDCHPSAALRRVKRGVIVGLQGRPKEAAGLFQDALDTARSCLGERHQDVRYIQEYLILCLAADGQYASALNEIQNLEKNIGVAPGESDQSPTRRIEQYREALMHANATEKAESSFKQNWLLQLEMVKDEVGGVGWMTFLEPRTNEGGAQSSNFSFHMS